MLELYDNTNSVCAQKVRIALAEKGLSYQEHMLTLRGDQLDPEYLKLNPNGVVPTLVWDGHPVIESSVILYFIDETFPDPPLMPRTPLLRATVRMYNKLIDEYVHTSCMVMTFATAFRAGLAKAQQALADKTPNKKRAEIKQDVITHGLESKYVKDAIEQHQKLITWMGSSLKDYDYLAGEDFSLADIAVIPYIVRLDLLRLSAMWNDKPHISIWFERVCARPSVRKALLDRMTDNDKKPFNTFEPDPWPKVQELLKAA
jgi:glutathione S-transferase